VWMVVKAAATEAAGAGHSKKCACCVETNAGSSSSQTWVSYLFNNGGKRGGRWATVGSGRER
jgi:hypothetical protein